MDAEQFKALRAQSGLSQGGLADKLGVTRATINRWETGATSVADYVTRELMLDVTSEANVTPQPVTSKAVRSANVTPAIDLSKLTPWTKPLGLVERNFDGPGFHLRPGWQRCAWRVVSAKIPDPIPYDAPSWAGWRGVLTKSGRVFDYETGREMKPLGVVPRPVGPAPGSRQQLDKKYRRAM